MIARTITKITVMTNDNTCNCDVHPDDGDGETDDNNDDNEDDNIDNDDGYDGDVRPARKDSHCCQHSC